jgi:hypothetical protein
MHPPEQLYTPVVEIVAVADKVTDEVEDAETDARSTNAHTATWTIIPRKHAERENALKMTMAIQTLPGTTSKHAITAVLQDTSRPTASTLNTPGNNATKSTKALHC